MAWDEELYARLRGERESSNDIKTPIEIKIVRSDIMKGRLTEIQWGAIPRGIEIITARDIEGSNLLSFPFGNIPLLADEEISYLGQPLALVCGEDEAYLNDFINQIKIITEKSIADYFSKTPMESQIFHSRLWERGDVNEAFSKAHQQIEGEYRIPTQVIVPSTRICCTGTIQDNILSISYPNGWPEIANDVISKAIGYDKNQITISHCHERLPWDSDIWFTHLLGALTSLAVTKTKRSCRLALSFQEAWYFGPRRIPAVFHMKTALNEDNKITAMEVHCSVDIGAFDLLGQEVLDRMLLASMGVNFIKNVRLYGQVVKTSTLPKTPCIGFGTVQGSFAREMHHNRIAEHIHQDGWNYTKDIINKTGHRFIGGAYIKEEGSHLSVMEQTVEQSDLFRKFYAYELTRKRRLTPHQEGAFLRGIGFSSGYQGNGFLKNFPLSGTIDITLNSTGIEISPEPNRWNPFLSEQLIQDGKAIFEMNDDNIYYKNKKECDLGPQIGGRSISIIYNQIKQGFGNIQKKRFREALPISISKRYRRSSKRVYDGERMTGLPFHDLAWGSAVVEVEVDPIGMEIIIKAIWLTVDPGQVLNRKQARDSLFASTIAALSWALYEDPLTQNPDSFEQIYGKNQPPVHIFFKHSDKKKPKSLSALPWILIPAALTTAVNQALGVKLDSLPLTAENIKKQLEKS
ncbi:molybdopterin cofactor-binding domain-containing protein [Spirochaeta cellobiosiphila]|uniref:molybdopterin cofactor-binding domain-containing protein n=1 Tax=Spirochaeta cellobiosiphila TaxID=504483 RepID=UPI00040105E9|nr:molybdopterin cofactor-binding domain-containing protein [Spirochaeta cellobiosiphila]